MKRLAYLNFIRVCLTSAHPLGQAQSGLETLIELVLKDVNAVMKEVSNLPVSDETDRVKVTPEISKRIGNNSKLENVYQSTYRFSPLFSISPRNGTVGE